MVTPTVGSSISDLFMGSFMSMWCLAAGRDIQVGARFHWRLDGDLDGDWLMTLMPGETTLERVEEVCSADGVIDWTLAFSDVNRILQGEYGFSRAMEEGRMSVRADRPALMKLARAVQAMSRVDFVKAVLDPESHFRAQFEREVGLTEEPGRRSPLAGVSLRKRG